MGGGCDLNLDGCRTQQSLFLPIRQWMAPYSIPFINADEQYLISYVTKLFLEKFLIELLKTYE